MRMLPISKKKQVLGKSDTKLSGGVWHSGLIPVLSGKMLGSQTLHRSLLKLFSRNIYRSFSSTPARGTRPHFDVSISRDRKLFLNAFPEVRDVILEKVSDVTPFGYKRQMQDYYARLLDYTCVGGKMTRGLITVYASEAVRRPLTFKCTSPIFEDANRDQPNELFLQACASQWKEEEELADTLQDAQDVFRSPACYVGWCVEILQGALLVADDQMDGARLRRSKPCWHTLQDVGPGNAINDSIFLLQALFQVLHWAIGARDEYRYCFDLLHFVAFQTSLGQHIDTSAALKSQDLHRLVKLVQQPQDVSAAHALQLIASDIAMKQQATARLKTSLYSFHLPCSLGLLVSGVRDEALMDVCKNICVSIGEYFQAQDDFLDCFADPSETGKMGSDITEGKCSWLLAEALTTATPDVALDILRNYATKGQEGRVRELYLRLGLDSRFRSYEREVRSAIKKAVATVEHEGLQSFFYLLLALLKSRSR